MSIDIIEFYIDKQKFTTDNDVQTAGELLKLASEDPAETTLVLKEGKELFKYDDNQKITLKNGMSFVVFHDGPTPVSYFGPERFIEELCNLGYKPKLVIINNNDKYAILHDYVIQSGRFIHRTIDLGMLATNDFPISVTSAIHIRTNPQLYEKSDSVRGVRNITDSPLGQEWRYWSINFKWKKGDTVRRLMSKINTVFNNA